MTHVLVLTAPTVNDLSSGGTVDESTLTVDLEHQLATTAPEGMTVEVRHSADEGQLASWLNEANDRRWDVVLCPGVFSAFSYSLAGAVGRLTSSGLTVIEVDTDNPHAGATAHAHSAITSSASGLISGFGMNSFQLALQHIGRIR
ncbi:type II 3-dehydroquinate dehydratase [Lysinibacter cavernae]|uniref:3-dehydroquinate dehydratase n=1 Tax=Lysinibacter cavernae TaxID=1640652 RepID=A0A7X5QZ68_9MICO|nr:type II 3-dehydroquinate dehydratase [Lysinibacter cavernae]NIH52709.1 3-dehydroquinate dehydratase-2 [Lysinibacter cavernae]